MFLKRFIFLILIALLLATHASAQTPVAPETETKPTKEQQEEAQKKLTAQALELLDAVVKDAERLTLPENRLYASIAAADLLWEHDAQRRASSSKTRSQTYGQFSVRPMMKSSRALTGKRWSAHRCARS